MIANLVNKTNKRYLELDALRGFAAVFVMLFHYTEGKNAPEVFNLGVTGVDLFFLISGFVIFMSINNVTSGREFVINRVSRLYPTYWACVSISFGVILLLRLVHFPTAHDSHAGFIDYIANLTMFQYYLGIKNIDIPYWTMIIEMLFYLLILILYLFKFLKHIVIIGCMLNVLIILNYLLAVNKIIANYTFYFPLFNHFALFFGGILFYKIVTGTIKKAPGYFLIIFCLVTQSIIYKFAGSNPDHISFLQYAGMLMFYFLLFTLFVNKKLTFVISRPALFLGNISFALYLIHSYIFRGMIGVLEKRLHLPFWVATIFIAIPSAILLAYIITTYIEKPFGFRLKKSLKQLSIKG